MIIMFQGKEHTMKYRNSKYKHGIEEWKQQEMKKKNHMRTQESQNMVHIFFWSAVGACKSSSQLILANLNRVDDGPYFSLSLSRVPTVQLFTFNVQSFQRNNYKKSWNFYRMKLNVALLMPNKGHVDIIVFRSTKKQKMKSKPSHI